MTKISCQKRGNFFYIKELNFSYPGQKKLLKLVHWANKLEFFLLDQITLLGS